MTHQTSVLSRAQVRQLDRIAIDEFGLPGVVLMENAGRALASAIQEDLAGLESALVLCGPGNNGGDGFVLARYLHEAGVRVTLVETVAAERLSPAAATFQRVCVVMGIPSLQVRDASSAEQALDGLAPQACVVDALLGTGFCGALREPVSGLLQRMRGLAARWGSRIVAVDTPSGFDVDSGEAAAETLPAHLTLTLAANKPAFLAPECRVLCGQVRVLGIGIPDAVYERVL